MWCYQIITNYFCPFQKFCGYSNANRMNTMIKFIRIATAIPKPTSYRINRARFKLLTQCIFLIFIIIHYNFVGLGSFL